MATAVKKADGAAPVKKKVGPKVAVFQWQARARGDAKAALQKGEDNPV